MGPKSFAYRVCLLLTGLNLLGVFVAIAGTSRLLTVIDDLPAGKRAQFGAVSVLEFFLLAAISATAASITLYVRRGD